MSEEKKKIRTICVDTLTALQDNQYASDKKKPGHDQWFDYGISIFDFMTQLQNLGFETVLILGSPGTGKSFGMKTLPTDTNIWFNADNKNPTWKGGREVYGKKNTPKMPYHVVPKEYKDIISHIKMGIDKGMFEDDKIAFITGHTETYKEGNESKVRLKTLGKLANSKMQIEGKLEMVLYTKVTRNEESGDPEYLLETQNSGMNTARSNEGLLEGMIPNDYNLIVEKLLSY